MEPLPYRGGFKDIRTGRYLIRECLSNTIGNIFVQRLRPLEVYYLVVSSVKFSFIQGLYYGSLEKLEIMLFNSLKNYLELPVEISDATTADRFSRHSLKLGTLFLE